MQTTLSEQIIAIQAARKRLDTFIYSGAFNKEYDQALNDAGSTIASLNMVLAAYKKAKEFPSSCAIDHKAKIADEFFKGLCI